MSGDHRYRAKLTVLLAGTIAWLLLGAAAHAVVIYKKDSDKPICGYLVSQDDRQVVIREVLADGTERRREIPRSEILEILPATSEARLEELSQDKPEGYRDYAEELAARTLDPEARAAARRLFLIAAYLDPEKLGPSCLLAMANLVQDPAEQRRLRAMLYLLDPEHDRRVLTESSAAPVDLPTMTRKTREDVLQALRLLRQGKKREALKLAEREGLKEVFSSATFAISYDEFVDGCALVCVHCSLGKMDCAKCNNGRDAAMVRCLSCRGNGIIRCSHCDGDYREVTISQNLLKRVLQIELALVSRTRNSKPPPPPSPSWSRLVRNAAAKAIPPLTMETITEFDPRKCHYRDGKWVE